MEPKMKSIVIVSLIATCLFANASYAQSTEPDLPWLEMNNNEKFIEYVNAETIKDLGGGIKQAWFLTNYSTNQSLSSDKTNQTLFLSKKFLYQFNCPKESMALVRNVYYSQKNGSGDNVFSYQNKPYEFEWISVVPDSIGEVKLKIICAVKSKS